MTVKFRTDSEGNIEIDSLKTIVIYKIPSSGFKYLPEIGSIDDVKTANDGPIFLNKDNFKSSRVLYQGTSKNLDWSDFAEYDFKYLVEKKKFNDVQVLNYLDNDSKDRIGKNTDDLDKLASVIFPTAIESSNISKFDYFGAINLAKQMIILLNLEPDIYKVEIYDQTLYRNYNGLNEPDTFYEYDYMVLRESDLFIDLASNGIEPAITISLGPEKTCKNNSLSFYYMNDSDIRDKKIPVLDYLKLTDELFCGKVIWMDLSEDNTIKELNLSFNAWNTGNNANRNKSKLNLRNDDFVNLKDKFNIYKNIENTEIWKDNRTDLLLGNRVIEDCPLLKKKLRRIDNSVYSPNVTYKNGDRVNYEYETWISLCDLNRNNTPSISKEWIKVDTLLDGVTERITLIMDPIVGGYTSPKNQVTIDDDMKTISFKVIPNLSYKVGSDDGDLYIYEDGIQSFLEEGKNKDYIKTIVEEEGENYISFTISGSQWDRILKSDSQRLYFAFSNNLTEIKIKGSIDGGDIKDYVNLPLPSLNASKSNVTIDSTGIIKIGANTKINLVFNSDNLFDSKYCINDGYMIYKIDGKELTRDLLVDKSESGYYKIKDLSDYTEADYVLSLDTRKFISIYDYDDFEVSDVYEKMPAGDGINSYSFQFYSNDKTRFNGLTISLRNNFGELINIVTIGKDDIGKIFTDTGYYFKVTKSDEDIYTFTTGDSEYTYNTYNLDIQFN